MSVTPRPRSGAFPETPVPGRIARAPPTPSPSPPAVSSSARSSTTRSPPLPVAAHGDASTTPAGSQPLIPLTIIDAPQQRLYVCGIYVALLAWRLYDWFLLVEDNTESTWLFLKWLAMDCAFLFLLPELRIPWLELSQPAVLMAFFFHAVFDWMLMYNIPFPWQSWLLGMVKVLYDRELSVSENSVKASTILHNASLIMGKQIINILPEGSATLNPEGTPFCLGGAHNAVSVPIYFNATSPIEVELIRVDLNTNQEESMKLSKSLIREIEKLAKKLTQDGAPAEVKIDYPIKKPGAYRLGKVLDEYKLEVQRRTPYTYVVPCPKAKVGTATPGERCHGDLSDLFLEVDGTPPLKIMYSRTINGKDQSFHFQSLQPEGFSSPLMGSARSSSLTLHDDEDISWARAQTVRVDLNEAMQIGGEWQYSVDEVNDAFGNVVKYMSPADDFENGPKSKHLVQNFVVKERPRARLQGCDLRNPMKVAKGKATSLPVSFDISGHHPDDTAYSLSWQFSPIDKLTKSGDHGDVIEAGSYIAKNAHDLPRVSAPGLYTLKSVSTGSCEGEVQEPSSCLLLNPLEPKVSLRSENIPDICAGHSVGLRVDLDLIGTPPFIIRYDVVTNGEVRRERVDIPGVRYQMELMPRVAGHHKYIFKTIDDVIYQGQPLSGSDMVLEQNVKPPASAYINYPKGKMSACLEQEVDVDVTLRGEAPFTLEWELVHDGKRKQFKATDVESNSYKIKTNSLVHGGEYTLALTTVKDKMGCRNFLQSDLKISVRRQRPRAAFGLLEGKRRAMTIEDGKIRLPIRLTGDGPWTVVYQNLNHSSQQQTRTLRTGNDFIEASARGLYEIVDIKDNQCQGTVDPKASTFEVDWFERPELSLLRMDGVSEHHDKFIKHEVCEDDIDGFDINLKGSPPYHVEYEIRHKPPSGSGSISRKEFDAALGTATIQMDTVKAGLYTYKFSALADNLYNSDVRKFTPLVVEQRVNAKPSAAFAKPGQTFKYCMSEQEHEDKIPITLTGITPFYVEIEIKHQSGSVPETYRIPSISTNSYSLHIPKQYLRLGTQQIRIRKVRDARGCQLQTDVGGPSVQVQLFDAPTIYPLETRTDYCVGERIAYSLSGTPPFDVWYTFDGAERKAKLSTTQFRRIAEAPGEFIITSVSDKASECRAAVDMKKTIHAMPAVKVSKGRNARVDIHEGSEVEILFEFWGTPPFEFTYTRSTNARKGQKSVVLETRHDVSYEHSKTVRASQEGTYEVVAIKDAYCAFSTQNIEAKEGSDQKRLQY